MEPASFLTSLDLLYIGALNQLNEPDTGKDLHQYTKAAINLINNGERFSHAFHAGSTLEKINAIGPTKLPIGFSSYPGHNANGSGTAHTTPLGIVHKSLLKGLYLKIEANLRYRHFSHSDLISYFKQLMLAGKFSHPLRLFISFMLIYSF